MFTDKYAGRVFGAPLSAELLSHIQLLFDFLHKPHSEYTIIINVMVIMIWIFQSNSLQCPIICFLYILMYSEVKF